MKELRKKLDSAITDFCALHGATPNDFEFQQGTTRLGRISGLLIWKRYDTMNVAERQNELWKYLFSVFSAEELHYITKIYTRGASEVDGDELAVDTSTPLPWEYHR